MLQSKRPIRRPKLHLRPTCSDIPTAAADAILDVESAGGRGISEALGLAGFTNLDVVRNPNLGPAPYLSQYMVHRVIGLPMNWSMPSDPRSHYRPGCRSGGWKLYIGRMGLPDFLDGNSVGTDSHLEFLNWTFDNNGAWDDAANIRGYTDGAVIEYVDHAFTARYGIAAMPTVANGIDLQYQFRQANGQNVDLEPRNSALPIQS